MGLWARGSLPLQRRPRDADPGPAGAGRNDGRGHGRGRAHRRPAPAWFRDRVDGPFAGRTRVGRAGTAPLRALAGGGIPVAGCIVRKLGDPVCRDAGHADRRSRRTGRRVARRVRERRLLPGRSAHDDRPDRQERHPDRRIRTRTTTHGRGPADCSDPGVASALPAHHHDVDGVLPRRPAAGALDGCGARPGATPSDRASWAGSSRRPCSASCSCRSSTW